MIVKNPAYGERIGEWGSRELKPPKCWYNKLEQEYQFYTKLRESMEREGVRNPIFCNSFDEGTFCRYGTSRLWLARGLDLDVPAVVADYVGRWDNLEELHTEEEIREKFIDQPEVVELGDMEMRIDSCPHTHLEESI